jgi:hypothetical protein
LWSVLVDVNIVRPGRPSCLTVGCGRWWLGAADVITTTLNEFRKDAAARRKQGQSAG